MQKKPVIRIRVSFLDETELYGSTFPDFLRSDLDHSTAAAIRSAIRQVGSDRA